MRRHHARFPRSLVGYAWGALVLVAFLLVAAAQGGWLMRSVLLDVVSLWPGWIITIWPVLIRRRRQMRYFRMARPRAASAPPMILLVWLVTGLGLHLVGWDVLPSSAANLAGPSMGADIASATLDIRLDGDVVLGSGAGHLYEVEPIRTGGQSAPAQGSEVRIDRDVTVRLREGPDSGWFGSDGWKVSISTSPEWTLMVEASSLEADLTGARLDSAQVIADGRIRLGAPAGDVPVHISGEVVLEVPSEASVELIGPAQVGSGWEITTTGKRYAGTGDSRYVLRVGSGSDLVVEQW